MSYDDWKLANPYDCPDGCGNDCCIPELPEDDGSEEDAPPDGWQDALDTWMRIWQRTLREQATRPDSARCYLVERTAYRRLEELMAMRPAAQRW